VTECWCERDGRVLDVMVERLRAERVEMTVLYVIGGWFFSLVICGGMLVKLYYPKG